MTKAELYQRVDAIRRTHRITMTADTNFVHDLCRNKFGLYVDEIEFKTHGLRGVAVIPNDQIFLNATMTPEQKKYNCAHELIHFMWHDEGDGHTFSCYERSVFEGDDIIEWQANEGAAELLMPRRVFLRAVADAASGIRSGKDYIYLKRELRYRFGVTDMMIRTRFDSLKYEVMQVICGTAPHEVVVLSDRQQRSMGINAISLNQLYIDRFVYYELPSTMRRIRECETDEALKICP